ncbi:MAG: ATP-binding domain-containing protein, partial [Caldilineaceae bacterium]|nr:ATP-binding domain-containing protein [Caldilineaceae bacterium]
NALTLTHVNQLIWLLGQRGWPVKYLRTGAVPDEAKRTQLYRNQIANFAKAQPDRYQALCFDAILVDEAQDFAPEDFALLLDLIKPHPETGEKTLVLCYDDAQNLYGRLRPVWRDIGINVAGGDRSRIMRHCFRNSRQTVELAFNVLTGTQAPPDLRVHTRQYADVAYLREHDLITEEVDGFHIHFADREDELPIVQSFPLRHAELDWVVAQLLYLIQEEAVRTEDILLLASKPSAPELDLDYLERQLHVKLPAIPLYFATARENKDQPLLGANRLTFSTVYSAKGYDAPVVFVIGADLFPYTKEGRAEFYVAATRAKLRLFISGVWRDRSLLGEAAMVRARLCDALGKTVDMSLSDKSS